MATKKTTHHWPRISVDLTPSGPVVSIDQFENLSPVKIEKCFEAVTKEWNRLRAVSVHERRKKERQEERAGAENG